jgi:predicted permease
MWLEDFAHDVRYAVRNLCSARAYSLPAVLTLALAIGTSVAMFSVVDAVLLEPLPYRAPARLAMLWTEDPTTGLREGRSALADVERWRDRSETFEDLATFDAVSTTLTSADGAEQIVGASISRNLLPVLGVQPVRGRGFSTEEGEQPGLAVIGHRFWQQRFGGSDDAVGATIVLNGAPFEIIGILPAGVEVATVDADVWLPNAMAPAGQAGEAVRGGATWFVVGRLRSTATFDEARTEMRAVAARLNDQLPAGERNRTLAVVPLDEYVVGTESRLALWLLAGAAALVFLIAVVNVASLSLARGVARAREIATRTALGASGARIVRQLLGESVLLAVVSGLLGTLLAAGAIRLIRAVGPVDLPRLDGVTLDLRAAACALGVSLLAAVVVSVAPSTMALRSGPRPSDKDGSRTVSGGKSTTNVRRALVVGQLASATVLLVGAGLLVRSWERVNDVDLGFSPERVLSLRIAAPTGFDDPSRRAELYDGVLREIRAVPGVEAAGMIGDLWIANDREQMLTVERGDGTVSERVRFRRDEVSAEFFEAAGTPLRQGRSFSTADRPGTPLAAIVNEAMAAKAWPGEDPVGRRLKLGPGGSANPWYTVVGVVGDMRRQGPEHEVVPQMFEALAQNPPRGVEAFVRTTSDDPAELAGALRAAVRSVERNAPIYAVAPLETQIERYLEQRRFQTSLITGFSIMALLLAAVGIYGLVQYSIATRTQELGLRMAVGARAVDIFRLVLGEGFRLCLAGLALGLVATWGLKRLASSLLFGVDAGDPWTFAAVALLLSTVALAACYFPARRAAALDSVVALRLT